METEVHKPPALNLNQPSQAESPITEPQRDAPSLATSLKFVSIMKTKLANNRANREKEIEKEKDSISVLPEWSGMCELNHLGFPGTIQCVAYDPVQSLLALGTSSGQLIILGQQGLTVRFQVFKFGHFQKIIFLSHLPLIITLNSVNTIHMLDLANLTCNQIYRSPQMINTISCYPHSRWIFLGFEDGRVLMLDVIYGWISNYLLPPMNCPVIKILPHPINFHQILVGYVDGSVVLFDLRQAKPLKKFNFNENPEIEFQLHLTALSWNPNAEEFVCGFDNGWMAFYKCDEDAPVAIRTINDAIMDISLEMALPDSYERIFDIKWCNYSDNPNKTTLLVAGGDVIDADQSVRRLDFKPNDYNNVEEEILFSVPSAPIDICVFPKDSPWFGGCKDPQVITILCNMGQLKGFSLDAAELELPYILETRSTNAQPFHYVFDCPPHIFETLTHAERVKPKPRLDLNGGIVQPPTSFTNMELLVALDPQASVLRFYDSSRYHSITNLHYLKLSPNQFPSFRNFGELKLMGMDVETGFIWIGMENGALLIYEFCAHVKCKRHSPHPSRYEIEHDQNDIANNQPLMNGDQSENQFLQVNGAAVKLSRSHSISSIHNQKQIESNFQSVVVDLNTDCRFRLDWFKERMQDDVKPYPYCSILGLEETPNLLKVHHSILIAGDKRGNLVIFNLKSRHFLYPYTPLTSTEESKPNVTKNPALNHFNQSNDYVTSCHVPKQDILKYILLGTKNGHLFRYNFESTISGLELFKVECLYSTKSSETISFIDIFPYQMTPDEISSTSKTPSTPGALMDKLITLTRSNNSDTGTNGSPIMSPTEKLKKAEQSWTTLVKQISSKKGKKNKSKENNDDSPQSTSAKPSLDIVPETEGSDNLDTATPTSDANSNTSPDKESAKDLPKEEINQDSQNNKGKNGSPKLSEPENPNHTESPTTNYTPFEAPRRLSIASQTDPTIKELLVIGSEDSVSIFRYENMVSMSNNGANMGSEFGKLIKCKLIYQDDQPILICLSDMGIVYLYQLPDLLVVLRSKISDWNPTLSHSVEISNQGKIFYRGSPSEAKVNALFFNEETEELSKNFLGQLYNPRRVCPDIPTTNKGWWSSFNEIRQDTILAMFDRGRPTEIRPIDRSQNSSSVNNLAANGLRIHSPRESGHSRQSSIHSHHSPSGEAPKSGIGKVLAQNTDKLKERYEELERLDDKTKQTAEAAEGFLDAIKEYNQKQANKKWYQW